MDFLSLLMRGGSFGHYWTKQSKRTTWWSVSNIPTPPHTKEDTYFGVFPSKVSKGPTQRTTEEDVAALTCLYTDYDLKDFSGKKENIEEHIRHLTYPPSVIISSGGGYHCYWLLEAPKILRTDEDLQEAKSALLAWSRYVKGDRAVHDLARVMRLPDTFNYKYTPPRRVEVVYEQLDRRYKLSTLLASIPKTPDHRGEVPKPQQPNTLTEQEIVDLAADSQQGPKFRALFKGSDLDYASTSEADMAFCCLLAFWTGGDYRKMDRIFRASGRMRDKWEREEYRYDTLTKAILQVSEYYVDPGGLLTAGAHDEGNAQCIASRVRDHIAYCPEMAKPHWVQYKDGYWSTELALMQLEGETVQVLKDRRTAAVEAEQEAIIKAARPSSSNVRNAITLLRNKVAVPISEFDNSPDLLNCINGVVDLRTGELLKHRRDRKFTYAVPTRYNPGADSDFWEQWLLEVLGGRQEVLDYVQLALGYSLTGRTREEVMFFVYGPTRGGKGTFTETIIFMLGGRPIATEVDMEMFMSGAISTSSVRFSLADLKAARFVAASETKESEWLNAKRIKRWTGNNIVSCAHKYGRDFSYRPQFKIWLTSNFEPQMDADDDAAWGRLRIIRFPNSYYGREDKLLKTKMLQQDVLEGILNWAVQGSIRWYKSGGTGLVAPTIVTQAVEKARKQVDWVAAWIEEMIEVTDENQHVIPQDMYYPEYEDWCRENGVNPKGLRSLNNSLKRKGYDVGNLVKIGGKNKQCWIGAQLNGYRPSIVRLMEKKDGLD